MSKFHQNILIGITGSVAAYKSLELIRLFKKANYDVRVCLSDSAEHFITPLSCQTLSGHPTYQGTFDTINQDAMDHITLAKWAAITSTAKGARFSIAL